MESERIWGTIYYDLSKIRIELRKEYSDVQVEVSEFRQVKLVRCTAVFTVIQPEGASGVGDSV